MGPEPIHDEVADLKTPFDDREGYTRRVEKIRVKKMLRALDFAPARVGSRPCKRR